MLFSNIFSRTSFLGSFLCASFCYGKMASEHLLPISQNVKILKSIEKSEQEKNIGKEEEKKGIEQDHDLTLSFQRGRLTSNLEGLFFSQKNKKIHFSSDIKPLIFIRDSQYLNWDQSTQTFVSKNWGETEVILTYQGNLIILPVKIEKSSLKLSAASTKTKKLTLPNQNQEALSPSLVEEPFSSLESVQESEIKKPFPSVEDIIAKISEDIDPQAVLTEMEQPISESEDNESFQDSQSIANSEEETQEGQELEKAHPAALGSTYTYKEAQKTTRDQRAVVFQVLEEGSDHVVNHVQVSIDAIGKTLLTEGRGKTQKVFLPEGSQFLVHLDDPQGLYKAASAFVSINEDVITLRAMKQSTHDALSLTFTQEDPEHLHASVCYQIVNKKGVPQSDISVSLDRQEEDKPLFFDDLGYPNEYLEQTTGKGRFCLWNIKDETPFALTLTDKEGQILGVVPGRVFEDRHQENNITLTEKTIQTSFLTLEWESRSQEFEKLRFFDPVDLSLLGQDKHSFEFRKPWTVSVEPLALVQGQSFYLASDKDFERTLYSWSDQDLGQNKKTFLLPKGTMEMIGAQSNIYSLDPSLGQVLIEKSKDVAKVQILDEHGVHLSHELALDQRISVFFSVEPGIHTVQELSEFGDVISSRLVIIYSDTLSFLNAPSNLL